MDIITHIEINENMVVSKVTFTDPLNTQVCTATINPDDHTSYTYTSNLIDDKTQVVAPEAMSLADCILAAYIHLGGIPPQVFESIECDNQH